jgi:hypothetical protein
LLFEQYENVNINMTKGKIFLNNFIIFMFGNKLSF